MVGCSPDLTRSSLLFWPVLVMVVGQEEGGIVGGGVAYSLCRCACYRLPVRSVERTFHSGIRHGSSVPKAAVVGA